MNSLFSPRAHAARKMLQRHKHPFCGAPDKPDIDAGRHSRDTPNLRVADLAAIRQHLLWKQTFDVEEQVFNIDELHPQRIARPILKSLRCL